MGGSRGNEHKEGEDIEQERKGMEMARKGRREGRDERRMQHAYVVY